MAEETQKPEKTDEPQAKLQEEKQKGLYLIVMSNGAVRSVEQLMLDYDLNIQQGIFTHVFNLNSRQLYAGNNKWQDIPHVVFTIPDTPPKPNGDDNKDNTQSPAKGEEGAK